MLIGTSDLDGMVWYIDPVAGLLLLLFLLALAVLLSLDGLVIVKKRRDGGDKEA